MGKSFYFKNDNNSFTRIRKLKLLNGLGENTYTNIASNLDNRQSKIMEYKNKLYHLWINSSHSLFWGESDLNGHNLQSVCLVPTEEVISLNFSIYNDIVYLVYFTWDSSGIGYSIVHNARINLDGSNFISNTSLQHTGPNGSIDRTLEIYATGNYIYYVYTDNYYPRFRYESISTGIFSNETKFSNGSATRFYFSKIVQYESLLYFFVSSSVDDQIIRLYAIDTTNQTISYKKGMATDYFITDSPPYINQINGIYDLDFTISGDFFHIVYIGREIAPLYRKQLFVVPFPIEGDSVRTSILKVSDLNITSGISIDIIGNKACVGYIDSSNNMCLNIYNIEIGNWNYKDVTGETLLIGDRTQYSITSDEDNFYVDILNTEYLTLLKIPLPTFKKNNKVQYLAQDKYQIWNNFPICDVAYHALLSENPYQYIIYGNEERTIASMQCSTVPFVVKELFPGLWTVETTDGRDAPYFTIHNGVWEYIGSAPECRVNSTFNGIISDIAESNHNITYNGDIVFTKNTLSSSWRRVNL